MWPFLVAIAAILGWVVITVAQSKTEAGQGGAELDALTRRVAELEGDRNRLRLRIEHLEAIVTSEAYELDRSTSHLGRELAEAGGPPPLALEEPHDPEDAETRAAQMAHRLRGG